MMVAIALFIFGHGLATMDGGFFENLQAQGAGFAGFVNPESNLYFDFFSTFAAGFIVTFALMMQPHILTKTLY